MIIVKTLLLIITAESLAWLFLRSKKNLPDNIKKQGFIINYQRLKKVLSMRYKILSGLQKHYYLYDATLGYRLKANKKPYLFKHKFKNFPELLKDTHFFDITTDNQGFIANTPNQKRDYQALANDNTIFKILVSGASTVAGAGASSCKKSWPALLEHKLNNTPNKILEKYSKIVVINSAVFGYNISQEIKRFQEETIYLNPNLVISFNGITESAEKSINPIDYSNHIEQNKMSNHFNAKKKNTIKILLPNIRNITLCYKYTPLHEMYHHKSPNTIKLPTTTLFQSKIKQFKATCNANNIEFIHILRPTMGLGNKKLSNYEKKLSPYFKTLFFATTWEKYLQQITHFYKELKPMLDLKTSHDFTQILDNSKKSLYSDPRHLNDHGNKIIANEIFNIINKKNDLTSK